MSNAANKTKRTKQPKRTVTQVKADIATALNAEHVAVERADNGRAVSITAAWSAAERTNVLYRELAALRGE